MWRRDKTLRGSPTFFLAFLLLFISLAESSHHKNLGQGSSDPEPRNHHGKGNDNDNDSQDLRPSKTFVSQTEKLNALYQDALKEGGRVIVYAGGDTPGQQDYAKKAFEKRFPGMTLDIIVDYSKFHNGRIDFQRATGKVIPDVIQWQTLQDFPRLKKEGALMKYKPLAWNQVFKPFKDPDGYYTAVMVIHFSNVISRKLLPDPTTWPTEARDYLKPRFKGNLIVTYPNDDDAVLFWFKQIVDKYGWQYVLDFAKQRPILVRGTQEPQDAAGEGRTPATPSSFSGLSNSPDYPTAIVLPKKDPFVTWPQTAAILQNASRPAGAKLYMSWLLDAEFQGGGDLWSVRRDAPLPIDRSTGNRYKGVFRYPGQMNPLDFGKFMADREAVELFRSQITLLLGEVQGPPSPGYLGLYPEKALPH